MVVVCALGKGFVGALGGYMDAETHIKLVAWQNGREGFFHVPLPHTWGTAE